MIARCPRFWGTNAKHSRKDALDIFLTILNYVQAPHLDVVLGCTGCLVDVTLKTVLMDRFRITGRRLGIAAPFDLPEDLGQRTMWCKNWKKKDCEPEIWTGSILVPFAACQENW